MPYMQAGSELKCRKLEAPAYTASCPRPYSLEADRPKNKGDKR